MEKKVCKKCGYEFETNLSFCPKCGEKNEEEGVMYCGNCGSKLKSTDKFCNNCGMRVGDTKTAQQDGKSAVASILQNLNQNGTKATLILQRNILYAIQCVLLLLSAGILLFKNLFVPATEIRTVSSLFSVNQDILTYLSQELNVKNMLSLIFSIATETQDSPKALLLKFFLIIFVIVVVATAVWYGVNLVKRASTTFGYADIISSGRWFYGATVGLLVIISAATHMVENVSSYIQFSTSFYMLFVFGILCYIVIFPYYQKISYELTEIERDS